MKKENILHDDVQKIKEKVKETSEAFSQTAHDITEEIKIKSHDLEEKVIQYVHKNPLKSLGIAVLSGMFLTLLLKKK